MAGHQLTGVQVSSWNCLLEYLPVFMKTMGKLQFFCTFFLYQDVDVDLLSFM